MSKSRMSVGERIEQVRRDMCMNQQEFADFLAIGRSTYSLYKSGKRSVPHCVFDNLIAEVGVDARWIVTGHAELANSNNEQLIQDCVLIYGLIDRCICRNQIEITDRQRTDVIHMMVVRREEDGKDSFYDRGYLDMLVRKFTNNQDNKCWKGQCDH